MPRAVLDANILISGTFWKGASHRVLCAAELESFDPIISPEIFREYIESVREPEFQEKIRHKALVVLRSERHLWRLCEKAEPIPVQIDIADPDDAHLFGCAFAARATHIVTNDKVVLGVRKWKDIVVVTPEEFLELL